jgi:hypothetical protein
MEAIAKSAGSVLQATDYGKSMLTGVGLEPRLLELHLLWELIKCLHQ